MACQRASSVNAPGPDALPNEIIKFLPDTAHDLIFQLFKIMAKRSYTQKMVHKHHETHIQA
jgi:cation transport regulator ChaB